MTNNIVTNKSITYLMPFNSYSSTYISRTWVMSSGYSVRFLKQAGTRTVSPLLTNTGSHSPVVMVNLPCRHI